MDFWDRLRLLWWLRWWRICLQCGRLGFDPWIRKIPGEGNGYPLWYSCLKNSMDKGACWTTVHGVPKSWTWVTNTNTFLVLVTESRSRPDWDQVSYLRTGEGQAVGGMLYWRSRLTNWEPFVILHLVYLVLFWELFRELSVWFYSTHLWLVLLIAEHCGGLGSTEILQIGDKFTGGRSQGTRHSERVILRGSKAWSLISMAAIVHCSQSLPLPFLPADHAWVDKSFSPVMLQGIVPLSGKMDWTLFSAEEKSKKDLSNPRWF